MNPALHRMETSLMSFGRKAAIAVAAFATVGSTLFGGVALAGDDHRNGDRPGKDDKKVVKVHKKDVKQVQHADTGDASGGGNDCKFLIGGIALNLLPGGNASAPVCSDNDGGYTGVDQDQAIGR